MLAATAVSDPGRAQVVTRQPAAHADAIAAKEDRHASELITLRRMHAAEVANREAQVTP